MPSDQAMRAAVSLARNVKPIYALGFGSVEEAAPYIAAGIDIETHLPALLAVAAAARELLTQGNFSPHAYCPGCGYRPAIDGHGGSKGKECQVSRLRAALEALPPANAKEEA